MSEEKPALTITRLFRAPRHLLFRMWSDSRHMKNWGCPVGFTVVHSTIDFRVGGKWSSCMRAPDGTEYRLLGEYLEIVPDERIVNTSAWLNDDGDPVQETIITLKFRSVGNDTELTLHQTPFETPGSRDSHQEGWMESLTNLSNYLDTMGAPEAAR
ncbi:MAG: SRPBCC domain-containing protein [Alphaproteobacteria bacterium]|nr:SRPBCC domain-containing protein [Alphaproteobacteria bacterium]